MVLKSFILENYGFEKLHSKKLYSADFLSSVFLHYKSDNTHSANNALLKHYFSFQARFQQRQMQEKEEKLLRLYENQQQRAFDRASRGSAGSNSSITSTSTTGGKVRQMFDERRQKAGVDKSYPLEPLKPQTRTNGFSRPKENLKTVVKTTTQRSISHVKNGNTLTSKNSLKKTVYNNNGGEESYEEHVFDNDNGSFFTTEDEMIALMNNHNLADSLEDEILPDLGIDETDLAITRKLNNVGGMPRQNGFTKRANVISTKVQAAPAQKPLPAKKDNKVSK